MQRSIGLGGALALGVTTVLLATPALAADTQVLHVPSDVDFSQSGATGHYEVTGTGLHIWTDSNTGTDKIAGYVQTLTPLEDVGEPTLDYSTSGGGVPGFQLVVDFNGEPGPDGILIGEPGSYGNDWWLSTGANPVVKAAAPSKHGAPPSPKGSGNENHGTLDEWRAMFPYANVIAFGFSLGSGVLGDGVLNAIDFADTTYTFVEDITLTSKDQCKDGGWATSYPTTYTNQGECVSHFAKLSPKQLAKLK